MPRDCSARSKEKWMRDALERRRDEGTLRELRTAEGDHCFIDFTSNDYLGLGRSKELRMEIEKEEVKAWEVSICLYSVALKCALCITVIRPHFLTLCCKNCSIRREDTSYSATVGSLIQDALGIVEFQKQRQCLYLREMKPTTNENKRRHTYSLFHRLFFAQYLTE